MFPGPIIMTSNCIIEPMKSYKKRIYTRGPVGFSGVQHLETPSFSAVIKQAQELDGFEEDEPEKYFTTGFGKNTVLSVAPQVIDHVQKGIISHFFLIGGCDGSEGERSYFRDVAKLTPDNSVILTLACGKYRFNDLDFGDIGGIPRMLDMGQCNDSYGAIQVAVALANAFKTDVNQLPLSFVVSWFEQKAVAVLLTLLHLGIKKIYLGPHLPAFCTPTILNVLVETFDLRQIHDPKQDVADMLAIK
jgi:hydroxylamine reductase